MRILIVEDDAVSRRLLESLLQKWGHEVVVCARGSEVRDILQDANAPRLAILDWIIPDVSGPDLCREVRALTHGDQFYLLLLTACRETADLVVGLEAGANDYVTKPFAAEELKARLNAGIRTLELQAQKVENERLNALVATAGAAAHEINQPLTIIMGMVELMRYSTTPDDAILRRLDSIDAAAGRIRDLVVKMADIDHFATKPYVGNSVIVDFDAASDHSGGRKP